MPNTTILQNIISEDLVTAKSLVETRLRHFVSEYMDAKKVQIVAERFNNGVINYVKFITPRMTKTELKEAILALNEHGTGGHEFNQVAKQHGFDLDERRGQDHTYVNYRGHEIHANHGNNTWHHYDVAGYKVKSGEGTQHLKDHLATVDLNEAMAIPEKEHPYSGLAKEFGFKQKGPGQIRLGITATAFDHPATNATLKLYHHHDLDKYSFQHKFGSNMMSGSGDIQLRNRLKTFHNAELPENPERYEGSFGESQDHTVLTKCTKCPWEKRMAITPHPVSCPSCKTGKMEPVLEYNPFLDKREALSGKTAKKSK